MEALTGWPAKDEWDFEYLGDSNHPFIKANYPHHEGIWGWGTNADQVVMMIRNIRKSMVEYHDILWDIGYAKTWVSYIDKNSIQKNVQFCIFTILYISSLLYHLGRSNM